MKEIDIKTEGIYKESDSFRRTREKAMLYLSYGDHTVRSMHNKLSENGFESDDINEVLKYLVERGYINEELYFERFCNHCAHKKGYGRRRIEVMAKSKGFSRKTFTEMADIVFSKIDFYQICFLQLSKMDADLTDKKSREKAIASLVRKGFSLTEIKKAVSSIINKNY